jgi:endonuclease/exonuclease/phosphatase family metal-dependent hydrolase
MMTRNIYLGADVGVALQLLPDFPAAAQFMWDQMRATNFEKRSRTLAKELALYKPDLVGVQEATKWICKKGILSKKKVIFDFLQILINESKRQGVGYSIATKDGARAFNTGFSIPAIPRLTVVKDPTLFPSIFGGETASCGFEIADAILIRDDFDGKIAHVGNSEYRDYYTVVPALMEIYRGYSWLDLDIDGQPIRIVTTHLESLFDEESVPHSSIQADQLIADLASTNSPLVVMGDFNADPRDPRGNNDVNPGGQPAENKFCNEQGRAPSQSNFDSSCNAYWKMIKAGYEDVGPNSQEPKNFTWGLGALLDGPDPAREMIARKWGNPHGFTERLDYIFIKNGISVKESRLVSHQGMKETLLWDCNATQEKAKCAPSDHAGVFAQLALSPTNQALIDGPLPDNQVIPWVKFILIGLLLLILSLIIWLPYRFILRPLVILPLQTRMRVRAERGIEINE